MIYLISLAVILLGIVFTFRAEVVTQFGLKGVNASESYVRQFAWSLRLQGPLWVLLGLYILISQFVQLSN